MKVPVLPLRNLTTSPAFYMFVAFAVGVLFGDSFYGQLKSYVDWAVVLVGLLVVLAVAVLYFYDRRSSLPLVSFAGLACFVLGTVVLVDDRKEQEVIWAEGIKTYRVMVEDAPVEKENVWQFTGRVLPTEDIPEGSVRNDIGKLVRCSVAKKNAGGAKRALVNDEGDGQLGKELLLRPGDELLMRCRITELHNTGNPGEFDYAKWLRRQGVSGMAFCYAGYWMNTGESDDMPLTVKALRARSYMVERSAKYLPDDDLAVFSAITLGDKTKVDKEIRNVYSSSGVSHVLALSGLHLGILFGLWQIVLKHLDHRRRRFFLFMRLLGLLGLLAFAYLAGFPKSLVRAALMLAFCQMQHHFQGEPFSVNNLFSAGLVILLFSPQALFDVGFQLSFASVLGILLYMGLLITPKTLMKRPVLRWVVSLALVSVVAQLATFPLVAYYFHTIPLYGVVSNFVAVPVAYLLLMLGLVFYVVPFLQPLMAPVLHFLLSLMNTFLGWMAEVPGGVLHFRPSLVAVLLIYVVLAMSFRALRRGVKYVDWRFVRCAVLAFTLCVGVELYAVWRSNLNPQIIFYGSYGGVPVHFIQSSSSSYLWMPSGVGATGAEKQVEYLKDGFWADYHVAPPVVVADTLRRDDCLVRGNVAWFGGKTVARVNARLRSGEGRMPLAVDYLLIERGSKSPLSVLLEYYSPRQVVLSASLSDYYRRRYAEESRRQHLQVYDMQAEGALRVEL